MLAEEAGGGLGRSELAAVPFTCDKTPPTPQSTGSMATLKKISTQAKLAAWFDIRRESRAFRYPCR